MDNNFVGGDVIPNYFRIIFFLPKNHILILSDCLFVNECLVLRCLHLFVFLSSARHRLLACLYSSTCTLRVCMTFSYGAENFRFLIVLKNFSTLGHKPSLFRFLDLGLVLPQEDGSSNDISFLTSQWRLVCDWIFVLCRPLTSLHTISFIKKRYMCVCWWVYLFVSYCDFEMERQMKRNWSNFRLIYRRSRGCTGCFTRVPQMKM